MSRKNTLSLNQKVELIDLIDNKKQTVKQAQKALGCGKTQIYEILKRKTEILEEWRNGSKGNTKRKAQNRGNEEINLLTWKWFVQTRNKNISISGPMVQAQARVIAERLGNPNFKASKGWLESFKARHNISWNNVCAEENEVDLMIDSVWKLEISRLVKNYEPRNVFNGTETAIFFQAVPSDTSSLKDEICRDGKYATKRLTVFICCNVFGEFEIPIVIGETKSFKYLKKMNSSELPVIWKCNKNAWNTSHIMEEWLIGFNERLKNQNRKIILFLENIPCHPNIKLSHIELEWFPSNRRNTTQPMDQGVIYYIKVHYRRLLLQFLISNSKFPHTLSEVAKDITVLGAVHWISEAIKCIKKGTVIKCFKMAGFSFEGEFEEKYDENIGDINALRQIMTKYDITTKAVDYVFIDEDLTTYDLVGPAKCTSDYTNGVEEFLDEEHHKEISCLKSYEDAHRYLKILSDFALQKVDTKFYKLVSELQYHVEEKIVDIEEAATSVDDLFSMF